MGGWVDRGKMIIVSALSLNLRDKERLRKIEIERERESLTINFIFTNCHHGILTFSGWHFPCVQDICVKANYTFVKVGTCDRDRQVFWKISNNNQLL